MGQALKSSNPQWNTNTRDSNIAETDFVAKVFGEEGTHTVPECLPVECWLEVLMAL